MPFTYRNDYLDLSSASSNNISCFRICWSKGLGGACSVLYKKTGISWQLLFFLKSFQLVCIKSFLLVCIMSSSQIISLDVKLRAQNNRKHSVWMLRSGAYVWHGTRVNSKLPPVNVWQASTVLMLSGRCCCVRRRVHSPRRSSHSLLRPSSFKAPNANRCSWQENHACMDRRPPLVMNYVATNDLRKST